jgi:hypothetical protein
MNILFLCHNHPNYVPDLLLHGLRKFIGDRVVDFPRKDPLYEGTLGQPFLEKIPDLMPSDEGVDRSDIATKLQNGFFELVLCDVRALKANLPLLSQGACRLALVDGEDQPVPLKPGRFALLRREKVWPDPSLPLPMGMPVEVIAWIDRHADTPKKHSIGFLGSRSKMTPDRNALLDALLLAFPDALVESWQYNGGTWQGRDAYYRNMQSCKIVLNLPGAGYDTFRYWENAACHAAHMAKRVPLIIPNDFREGHDIARFSSLAELIKSVEQILVDEDKWRSFAANSRAWLLAHHTTERRAAAVLDQLRTAFG